MTEPIILTPKEAKIVDLQEKINRLSYERHELKVRREVLEEIMQRLIKGAKDEL